MALEILPALLLSHVFGDFVLQPNSWVTHKEKRKWRSSFLYLHSLIHGGLFWMFTGFEGDNLIWAGCLTLTHGIIDGLKLSLGRLFESWVAFLIDQLLHLLVIGSIYYSVSGLPWFPDRDVFNHAILFVSLLLFATRGGAILIKREFGIRNNASETRLG